MCTVCDGKIAELGQILLNFTNVVPAGMVVFVPSYGFLNVVTEKWKASGVLDKLGAKKKVRASCPPPSSALD